MLSDIKIEIEQNVHIPYARTLMRGLETQSETKNMIKLNGHGETIYDYNLLLSMHRKESVAETSSASE